MATEPSLEQLSTYVDGELEAPARLELEEHLKTCSSCQARLEELRQTVSAVRALPMETPPRAFTVPAQRRQAWRWAPIGWIGGTAAALLAIALGLTQLHGLGGAGTAATSLNRAVAQAPAASAGLAPAQRDQAANALSSSNYANQKGVVGTNLSRKLIVEADAFSYSVHGAMRATVILQGSPSQSIVAKDQGLTLMLLRGGAGIELAPPVGVSSYNGTPVFGRTYDLGALALGSAAAGDYQLVATWLVPDGSGQVLQASIPVQLTGN